MRIPSLELAGSTRGATLGPRYDALVVGARCAGASTAMLLARAGLRVLVIDRSAYGADTLSTHALLRGGVMQLHRWGLLDAVRASGAPAVRRTTFHYGEERGAVEIKARNGVDALYAPRRAVLDALLVDAASDAGADVRYGLRLVDLTRSADGRITGAVVQDRFGSASAVEAGIVIGADGARSTVAALVDASAYLVGSHKASTIYGYYRGIDVDGYQWYYNVDVAAGAIPTNDELTCVFSSTRPGRAQALLRRDAAAIHHRLLAECSPALADAVAGAHQLGGLYRFAGQLGHMRRAWGAGVGAGR